MKWLNKFIIPLIIAVVTLCSSNIQWGNTKWKNIIQADGKGYYAYLPAVFIYQDLNFTFFEDIEKTYPNPHIYYDYRVGEGNNKANKYFAGTALAMSPFFLLTHLIAVSLGFKADGYSKIYPIMINIAAIFYLFFGLYFLEKTLLHYQANSSLISFILITLTFATNIFYYTVREPAMSHIYSFAFISLFIYSLTIFFTKPENKILFCISILFGIIVLIRPVNGIIILIAPFIAGSKSSFDNGLQYLRKQLLTSILSALTFVLIVFLQLLIYKIQTGSYWIDSYPTEYFNWTNPHPIDFLISYKKGVFVYTPLAFIALLGFVNLFQKNKFQFYSLTVFSLLLLYVLSSWWNWWYGGSFGSRVCVEYYPILALLIFFSYQFLKTNGSKTIYSALLICCLIVCQIQTYQYRYYIIHWEKMDKVHYWKVFLRVDLLNSENPNTDLLNH